MLTFGNDRTASSRRAGGGRVALPAVLCLCAILAACAKPPDRLAYEEVVATMSLDKARRFFERFPQSPCRDRLVDDLLAWCRLEGTDECAAMILDVIPKDHPRYGEALSEYRRRVAGRAR